MSQSYVPPHYTAVGIHLMGRMFEQQVRIAQTLGAVAIASNPLFIRPPADASNSSQMPLSASPTGVTPIRRSSARPVPQHRRETCKRTHATPV